MESLQLFPLQTYYRVEGDTFLFDISSQSRHFDKPVSKIVKGRGWFIYLILYIILNIIPYFSYFLSFKKQNLETL